MARKKPEGRTRQIYASVREELYLAAKARATELRMPLREFLEVALETALTEPQQPSTDPEQPPADEAAPSIWDDEYIKMQAQQPLGAPVELTREEAESVVRAAFGPGSGDSSGEGTPDV